MNSTLTQFAQYRVILTSDRQFDLDFTSMLAGHTQLGVLKKREKPLLEIYTITEEQYKLSDGYKIGLKANSHNLSPDESYYMGDFRAMLSKSGRKSHLEGVYLAYEFGMDSKPRLMDLIAISHVCNKEVLTEVFKVTHVRKGIMAWVFGAFRLEEINGIRSMRMQDFKSDAGVKVEILHPSSLPGQVALNPQPTES